MLLYFYLALGGAFGTLARYGASHWIHSWTGHALPWGTWVINVLGSLLLGLTMRLGEEITLSPEVRGLLAVGFLGAFTTFSTFSFETLALVQEGAWLRVALYSLGSVMLGLAAAGLGWYAGGLFPSWPG
jgi:CrcB protein